MNASQFLDEVDELRDAKKEWYALSEQHWAKWSAKSKAEKLRWYRAVVSCRQRWEAVPEVERVAVQALVASVCAKVRKDMGLNTHGRKA